MLKGVGNHVPKKNYNQILQLPLIAGVFNILIDFTVLVHSDQQPCFLMQLIAEQKKRNLINPN